MHGTWKKLYPLPPQKKWKQGHHYCFSTVKRKWIRLWTALWPQFLQSLLRCHLSKVTEEEIKMSNSPIPSLRSRKHWDSMDSKRKACSLDICLVFMLKDTLWNPLCSDLASSCFGDSWSSLQEEVWLCTLLLGPWLKDYLILSGQATFDLLIE